MNNEWKVTESFVIFEISNGVLINPKDKWDNNLFNSYGYATKEEAVSAIEKSNETSKRFVVLSMFEFGLVF